MNKLSPKWIETSCKISQKQVSQRLKNLKGCEEMVILTSFLILA